MEIPENIQHQLNQFQQLQQQAQAVTMQDNYNNKLKL